VDDVRVIAILEALLTFKFETFVNAEFIFHNYAEILLAAQIKYSASKITKE